MSTNKVTIIKNSLKNKTLNQWAGTPAHMSACESIHLQHTIKHITVPILFALFSFFFNGERHLLYLLPFSFQTPELVWLYTNSE